MEPSICPVCETPNAEDAQHCEVCGERLTPAAPGEEIPPEENVAATLPDEYPESALEALSQPEDDDEAPLDSGPDLPDDDFEPPLDAGPDILGDDDSQETPGVSEEPEFLFSSIDGTAYPKGSPEYEDGFGPMGDELIATRPDVETISQSEVTNAAAIEQGDPDRSDDEGGFSHDEFEVNDQEQYSERASAQFQAAFAVKPKERTLLEPLPQPGTFVQPATVTVYVDREPIHTHHVETDETLIGRRDPMADAFPDLDLTDYDDQDHISRKHAYIYRQNKNYTLYVVSNAGTQLNADLLDLGERRPLADGDVIVLAGKIAMKFEIPEYNP